MKRKSSTLRALFAASEQSADLLYLTGVFVPDPFLVVVSSGRSIGFVNRMEFGRVSSSSRLDEVRLLETEKSRIARRARRPVKEVQTADLIAAVAREKKARWVEVPADFPAVVFAALLRKGLKVEVVEGPFFPEREKKSDLEAKAIRSGNRASAAGIAAAADALRQSKADGRYLRLGGERLTSERLRYIIGCACLEKGAVASHTIVAGGRQACDPHEVGHGPLRPNELIIVDVFPRVQATGYHGDMTRTFLKGRANDAQRGLVAAVRAAQRAALERVKAGVSGNSVHTAACEVFTKRGYVTERREDGFVGFVHSTGHGLGLEIHEAPRVTVGAPRLKSGQVITIEPGLYYPETGGCRIEDVVRVTATGSERLSSCPYLWEIA